MAIYCGSCGRELSDDARFCSGCGRPIATAGAPLCGGSFLSGLVRPRAGRKIAGVCRAFANHTGWDVTALRVITVLFGIFLFPFGVIAYLVFWLLLPEEPMPIPPAMPPMTPVG
jgi:phage shock protein C